MISSSTLKRTCITALIVLFVFPELAYTQVKLKDIKINITAKGADLKEVLLEIEKQTGLSFFYLNKQVRKDDSMDINYADVSLEQVLMDLAKKSGVQFHRNNNQIVIRENPKERKPQVKMGVGAIAGKVTDLLTGEPLPGASVLIKGTTIGSSTDINGGYFIISAPEGEQILVFSYIGYVNEEIKVDVEAKSIISLDVGMTGNIQTLGEIVIKGSLEGQEKALNQQRTADNIKNIVSSDLIGRFPDLNVAEALQRIPGITINRERGEGSTVQIRGTPAHYTTISINGEQIPSTEEDGVRNESLDLIPSDILSSLEVTKALTPDMDGDAVGGAINLRTPVAKKLDPSVKLEVGGGYNDMSRGVNGLGRVKFGKRFFPSANVNEGRLGIILNGSYYRTDNVQDIGEAVWDYPRIQNQDQDSVLSIMDYRYRDLFNIRTRTGASLTVDYTFNPRHDLIFNVMYSRRADDDLRSRARYDPDVGTFISPTVSQNARIRRDLSIRENAKSNITYNLEGRHAFSKVLLDYGLFYTDSRREGTSDFILFDKRVFDMKIVGLNTDFPTFEPLEFPGTIHNPVLYDDLNRFERDETINEGSNAVARLNIEAPYTIGGIKGIIKGGAKYRRIMNSRERESNVYLYSPFDDDDVFANLIDDFEDSRYMNGNVRFGPSLNPDKVQNFFEDNFDDFTVNVGNSRINSDQADYDATEQVSAAYLMTRVQLDKLMLLAGVRAELTSVDYNANVVRRNQGSWESTDPVSGTSDFDFILPNIHVKYSLNSLTNLRAAFTYTYARPNFNDLVPFDNIDINSRNISRGNPDLLPAQSMNVDLMFERYLSNVGIISGGVFYKSISDFQVDRSFRLDSANYEQYVNDPTLISYRFNQAQNGDDAVVYGAEVNAQTQLDFLPGLLSGIGVYLNYSYVYSRATLDDGRRIRLPNQTDHFGNFALTYDLKGFTGRASLNYIGGVILAVSDEDGGELDRFREGRYQLDISASQQITERISAFVEFLNVTNTPQIEYIGQRNQVAEIEYIGWWNRFGISYKF